MPSDRTVASLLIEYQAPDGTSDAYTVDEIEDFTYSSDMMAVGDEATFTIVNPRRKYTGRLVVGSTVKLYLSNPRVKNGAETLKFLGRIIDRSPDTERGVIKLACADLGWHLASCDAPLWYRLEHGQLTQMMDPTRYQIGRDGKRYHFIDPSWGIKGYRLDNVTNRDAKRGLGFKLSAAQAQAKAQNDLAVFVVQVEPGDKVLDKIQEQARRYNLLINVSVDGYIQAWRPDYDRAPLYKIRCTDQESNVKGGQGRESARNLFTIVECVGEQIGFEGDNEGTGDNPNATKKRGAFVPTTPPVPYLHRQTFGDGEMFQRRYARAMAEWRWRRELFDSFYVTYRFPDHHLDGEWWESDQLADVIDDDLGVRGPLYVAQVKCEGARRGGDLATVTLRKPRLFTASFGVHPTPVVVRSSPPQRSTSGTPAQTEQKTELNYTPAGGQSR